MYIPSMVASFLQNDGYLPVAQEKLVMSCNVM